ncbi:CEAM1 protein, partial [Polypterus senegalus]|nr:CEAM1 protein [Polypterus senegalus]
MELRIKAAVCAVLSVALHSSCSGLSLTTPTSPIFGRVGGDVTFDVSPNPSNVVLQTVTWTVNNTNMVVNSAGSQVAYGQGYEGRAHLNTMTGSLSLFRLALRDSGQYSVSIGTTGRESASASVTLQVLDPASVPTIQSNVTNPVEFNDTVTLTCTASGSDISCWWFNGSSEVSDTQRIHLSADKRTLTISGVLRSDDGPFYCYVYNHVSNGTSKPFNLDVKSPLPGTVFTTEKLAGMIIGSFLGGVLLAVIAFLVANSIRRGPLCGKVSNIEADINENPTGTYENVHNTNRMDKDSSLPSPSTDHLYMGLQPGQQSIYHSLQGKMPA